MKILKMQLKDFKRFDDLTIDLGESPKKIIALVGPNGCGKSSIFDAFEEKLKDFRSYGNEEESFFSKAFFYVDERVRKSNYNKNQSIFLTTDPPNITRKSFYIRTAYRFTSKFNVGEVSVIPDILNLRDEPMSSISLDTRLESNYKRLLGLSYSEFLMGQKLAKKSKPS